MESPPHLPEELAIKILERLPPASSLRFQSICKSWRCIISVPGFLQRIILLQSKRRETSLIIAERGRDYDDVCLLIEPSYNVLESPTFLSPSKSGQLLRRPKKYFFDGLKVVGSCKGVVCLEKLGSKRCVLWNPITGNSMELDHDRDQVDDRDIYNLGFGHYDGDFKVVKLFKTHHKCSEPIRVGAKIYELRLDSWREISPTGIAGFQCFGGCHMVCWRDGKICSWITRDWKVDARTCSCIITSFDMANETFTNFTSPTEPHYYGGIGLLALNDLLALWCCRSHHRHQRGMDIWVLLHHGVVESWAKLWTIRVEPEEHWPMEIWNGGLIMTSGGEDRLRWCDLSISPQILQTIPDLASPSCSWPKRKKVVAFEKNRASLDSNRTTLICTEHHKEDENYF